MCIRDRSTASPSQTPINLAGSPTGVNYTVLVTDANGCTLSDLATVFSPDPITTTFAGGSNVTCNGGSDGVLSGMNSSGGAGGPYLYSINGSLPFVPALPSYTGLSAGPFTVIAQDANGCVGTTVETVIASSPIIANLVESSPLTCTGLSDGAFTATPTGGSTATYDFAWWSNGVNISNDPGVSSSTISGLSAGEYSVIITDGSGCLGYDTLSIGPNSMLTLSFSNTDVLSLIHI